MKKLIKKLSIAIVGLSLIFSASGCGTKATANSKNSDGITTLVIGASASPHAEILEFAKPILKEKGIKLDIKVFTDYVLPNTALADNELDANYFQHQPYLDDFNKKNGTDIISAGSIHFEPLGIYPGKSKNLDNIKDGSVTAIPNDVTNEARALQLLSSLNIITLKEGVGLTATINDIVKNPHNIKFQEVDAAQIPRTLLDIDFGVVNGNYALDAGIANTILTSEDKSSDGAQKFANIIAVKKDTEKEVAIKTLIEVLKGDKVTQFINDKYKGVIVPLS